MSVQQKSAPTLRRHVFPTELGPCTVRVQQGARGPCATSGIPDVYLHGAAGSWTTFRPLLSGAPANDRVLFDLPGWGESTNGARLEHFSVDAMARTVTGVLDALGYRRWNLVGHSMGGFLALHMAAVWPEQTASVAAISATTFGVSEAARTPLRSLHRFPSFAGMLLAMRSMAALGPAGTALVRAIAATPLMGPLMSPFFADPAAIPPTVFRDLGDDARPASFSAAARAAAHYDFGRWRGILCPVLAIRGDSDVFTPPSDLARLAEIVPHARLSTIPHCGHFANIERPEQVQRLLDDLWSRGGVPRPPSILLSSTRSPALFT
ncbi:alpha/beta fold hydrolase [Arthrobacter sp. B2a2-09]|uniref:alpha/beta fold hydrolase n=1 Tax=Arthrobacter sp. B2a2-09 TaxID=2952822 RepID=UPI0022CD96E4|nr:alpha/beta hydrolase [Arthrobacter sp. B2a2-09]MCZ9880284.1 alpha/beta hydrolase [Arthrobacter sp. B2a2-09]